jgi:hypothetical protein
MVSVVARVEHRSAGGPPHFAPEPLTGVSRRRAPLPSSFEVAPVVVAYLRQLGGDALIPPELEALLPAARAAGAAPARSRETVILIALAVVLFIAAFAVAFALLPRALA